MLSCTFGMVPSTLNVIRPNVITHGAPQGNIMDFSPANVPPFGMCQSPTNPTVVAATAAALGVFTPMPCVPTLTPWTPGSPTVLVASIPGLNNTSKSMCAFGGMVQVTVTPAVTEAIP